MEDHEEEEDADGRWRAKPHTLAKHRILAFYLDAWIPILSNEATRHLASGRDVTYVDAFAGPGQYIGLEDGSPILALKRALRDLPVPLNFLFVEKDPRRFACLQRRVADFKSTNPNVKSVGRVEPLQGDAVKELNAAIDRAEARGVAFGPAMCFLDQFGYGDVPMELVRRIMRCSECEIMAYFEFRNVHRFIGDSSKHAALDRAFGCETWRAAIGKSELEQLSIIRHAYERALREHGSSTYVQSFTMWDGQSRPLNYLFFATNKLKGLEVMKRAMWRVDKTGEFLFSDSEAEDGLQSMLGLKTYTDAWLAARLADELAGRTLSWNEVREHVLTRTPCINFKRALKDLERRDPTRLVVLGAPEGRTPGTYPDAYCGRLRLRFLAGAPSV
jgi:three-Cys-motif partner protein